MTNQSEWRWADPTGQQRLVREDELRAALASGVIPSNAPVWKPGWKQWKPASDVDELKKPPAPHEEGVPPPPTFIVHAQNQFEGRPSAAAKEEPPPPPRYVPANAKPQPPPHHPPSGPTLIDPNPPSFDSKPEMAKPDPKTEPRARPIAAVTVKQTARIPTAPQPAMRPRQPTSPLFPAPPANAKPSTKAPPPLPAKAKSVAPPPMPVKKSTTPPPLPAKANASTKKSTAPPPLPARAKSSHPAALSSSGERHTLPVAPAPPPMPRIDPVYIAPAEPPAPAPAQPSASAASAASAKVEVIPASKYPTLMMFGGEEPKPQGSPAKPLEEAPPIVVPPPEPSNLTTAHAVVTRPPPWGEGAVGIADHIPKAPNAPMFPPSEDRISDPGRQMELSSTDLTSEARLAVVKPTPLVAAERPRTIMGIGPAATNREDERAKKEAAEPPAPSVEVAAPATAAAEIPEPAPTVPTISPSRRKIHDLQEIAKKGASQANVLARKGATEASALAKRAYSTAREKTKDKPPWFLPAIAGGALVVFVSMIALVVHAVSGGSSASTSTSASASSGQTAGLNPTGATSTAKTTHASRAVACAPAGASRTVAPKALVPSGVEVSAIGSQIALGFATGPKEGVLEMLDPSSAASASSLHLPARDPIRRVLVYFDAQPQAALDADRKGDPLQGRRTVRANPPIDLGAMDGGLVWAPHNTDKGIKLWSLASDSPVEALRGEPLPENKGFAVAFRQGGAIYVSAFGGNPPAPLGPLLKVEGLGPQIGSPAIAASGGKIMVVWADRPSASDPWGLRHATIKPGDEAIHAQTFTLPPGGLGEQVMSPGLAGLSDGRFLLVWTEGQVSNHQVRAAVYDGTATQGAFTASAEGLNAGQGQVAVLPDGRGVIAFLAAGSGKSFEVVASPITCTEK